MLVLGTWYGRDEADDPLVVGVLRFIMEIAGRKRRLLGDIRGIVRYKVLTDLTAVEPVIKRLATYTKERFGDKFTFEPFANEGTNEVIFVNSAINDATLVDWLEALGDPTGFRNILLANMEITSIELLDPMNDPRLDTFQEGSSILRPLA